MNLTAFKPSVAVRFAAKPAPIYLPFWMTFELFEEHIEYSGTHSIVSIAAAYCLHADTA